MSLRAMSTRDIWQVDFITRKQDRIRRIAALKEKLDTNLGYLSSLFEPDEDLPLSKKPMKLDTQAVNLLACMLLQCHRHKRKPGAAEAYASVVQLYDEVRIAQGGLPITCLNCNGQVNL